MKKRVAVGVMTGMLAMGSIGLAGAHAQGSLQLTVLGTPVQGDSAPIVVSGRVLVPIRVVTEKLGGTVNWDAAKGTVTASKWSDSVKLTVGQKKAVLVRNGQKPATVSLDAPARLVRDRVYIPLRFVSETFGYGVDWDGATASVRSPFSVNVQNVLASGSLDKARQLMLNLGQLRYKHEPLAVRHDSEYWGETFLFPEGEALRYYSITGDTATRIEITDGMAVAVWQAHVKEDDAVAQFLKGQWTDARGDNPPISKVYYSYAAGGWGDSHEETVSRIDLQGNSTVLGYKREVGGDITNQEGTIAYALPDETRKEVVSFTPAPAAATASAAVQPGVSIDFPSGEDADEQAAPDLATPSPK
ncbi:copper amine oxidase N-terminal domain-containing protein [Cohnella zeiphila]|uniref:Copper amine oxidase N-terminal domain-containing protein n=1 Tax=Cohnella zeiphila TaxID=2761120 RepID=A0A7X0VWH3_9BACL|nr:copper amine oxidase N-terminal domain-containing protein [Cohnella zeiphila]MBB6733209.1 copper amine oxidase N-terminal domain-containing protein [Cohnella zeiphila]